MGGWVVRVIVPAAAAQRAPALPLTLLPLPPHTFPCLPRPPPLAWLAQNILHEILCDRSNHPYIRWNAAGNGFLIASIRGFEQCVLPKRYKHGHYTAFLRSVCYYGFTRVSGDSDSCEYTHPILRKDQPELLSQVRPQARAFSAHWRKLAQKPQRAPPWLTPPHTHPPPHPTPPRTHTHRYPASRPPTRPSWCAWAASAALALALAAAACSAAPSPSPSLAWLPLPPLEAAE